MANGDDPPITMSDDEKARLKALADAQAAKERADAAAVARGGQGSNIEFHPSPSGGGVRPISPQQAATRGYDPSGAALDARDPTKPIGAQAPAQQGGIGGAVSGLHDRWNEFIDHPENRAGMMQFAVNMLAGQPFGQAVGGAAEATGRNVAAQEEEEHAEEKEALMEQEAGRKAKETEYYGIGQKSAGSREDRFYAHQDAMLDRQNRAKARDAFYAFKNDPGAGMAIWKKVQAKYPELKDKTRADMTPEHEAYARSLIESDLGIGGGGGGPQPVYDKKTKVLKGYWDGTKYTPGEPQ